MAERVAQLSIQVDDGSIRVPITNQLGDEVGVFYFRPTDMGIVERYNELVDKFDEIIAPLEALNAADAEEGTGEQSIAAIAEATTRLYAYLDKMFAGNMSEAFFGKMHPFSPVQGRFYCEIAIEAVGNFIAAQFESETKKMQKRVEKYTKGYEQKPSRQAVKK